MRFFEAIFRLIFGSPPKNPLSELFQDSGQTVSGIVLEETGLPYGGLTTYAWWKTDRSGFFVKRHRKFRNPQPENDESETVQDETDRFDELFLLLKESVGLGNCSSNIRDGVVYRVFWGTRDRQQQLTINNPIAGTEHQQLVAVLKESAWE